MLYCCQIDTKFLEKRYKCLPDVKLAIDKIDQANKCILKGCNCLDKECQI